MPEPNITCLNDTANLACCWLSPPSRSGPKLRTCLWQRRFLGEKKSNIHLIENTCGASADLGYQLECIIKNILHNKFHLQLGEA
jgi:hypothetical protein